MRRFSEITPGLIELLFMDSRKHIFPVVFMGPRKFPSLAPALMPWNFLTLINKNRRQDPKQKPIPLASIPAFLVLCLSFSSSLSRLDFLVLSFSSYLSRLVFLVLSFFFYIFLSLYFKVCLSHFIFLILSFSLCLIFCHPVFLLLSFRSCPSPPVSLVPVLFISLCFLSLLSIESPR